MVGASPGKRLGVRGGEGRDGSHVFFNNGSTAFIVSLSLLVFMSVRKMVGMSTSL